MLAVGPLGPQYSLLFSWNELGKHAHLAVDTLPTQRVPQKILKKSISLYHIAKTMYTALSVLRATHNHILSTLHVTVDAAAEPRR